MRSYLLILVMVFVTAKLSYAQENEASTTEPDKEMLKAQRDSARAEKKKFDEENTIYKPIIGVGFGVLNYFGEINNNQRTNPLINNYGVSASVIKNFSPSFGVEFDVAYGKITANERSLESNRNFSTGLVTFNLQGTYNFTALLPKKRFINPYISLGVGAVNWSAKGDLKSSDGQSYNYWDDGTIRSLAQNHVDAENAEILRRDYVYETDLRKANLDSLGNYKEFAVVLPFTFGVNFRISQRSSLRLQSTFSYAFTDLIDNYTKDGVEGRKGNKANDMFLFTSVSYHFDFFTPTKKKKSRYDSVEFESFEGDSDNDGVENALDQCPLTPAGAMVDEKGCPLDSDGDGVFDYLDQEPNTDPNLNVNAAGEGLTDDMITLTEEDTLATVRAKMFDVYPDMKNVYKPSAAANIENESTMADSKYAIADTDGNGVISVNEVYNAIDLFFEGELDVNAAYINGLIDYFFDQ